MNTDGCYYAEVTILYHHEYRVGVKALRKFLSLQVEKKKIDLRIIFRARSIWSNRNVLVYDASEREASPCNQRWLMMTCNTAVLLENQDHTNTYPDLLDQNVIKWQYPLRIAPGDDDAFVQRIFLSLLSTVWQSNFVSV